MTTITRNKNKRTPARSSLVILHMLLPMLVFAQSTNQNYIHSKTFLDEDGISCIEEVAYFNGIGQPVQTVKKGITPSRKDLVILKEYDCLGRDSVNWLPIPVSNNNGAYRAVSTVKSDAVGTSIYKGDTKPYSITEYDPSPLGRVIRETGAGQAWHDNGKCVSTEYYTNDEGAFSCRRFNVSGNSHVVTLAGLWPPGALTATKTSDEDGRIQVVFKDFLGRAVLKRSVYENGNNDTYFIYDQRGNLQAVLPPAAVKLLENNAAAEEVSKYAYFYEYDIRGNCISKKLPGADPVKYRYDRSGRVVFSQDGNLRAEGKWHFYLYDSFGRQVVHGITRTNTPPEVGNLTVCTQYGGGTGIYGGYSANLSLSNISLLSVSFYDDYTFLDNERSAFQEFVANGSPPQGMTSANAKGMLTGSRTYVFSDTENNATENYCATAMYYDGKGRPVRSCSENQLGGYDESCTQYTFTGLPLKENIFHSTQGKTPIRMEYNYTYDHARRLQATTHSLNERTPVTLEFNTYDEVGRLINVNRINKSSLSMRYGYNVRSWLSSIFSNFFVQKLYYNESHNGSTPQWGGNISAMDWMTITKMDTNSILGKLMGYTLRYDGLSRLTQADYYENNRNSNHYDTRYTYDDMGNILSLQRNGLHDDGEFGLIDYLTFDYEGNQVTKVTDEVSDGPYRKDAWHYRDGSNREVEREYDGNGNLVKDSDAKISSIQYNLLNLPRMIKFSDGGKHVYTYDASGRKLRAEYHTPVMVAAEPQVLVDEQLLLPMGLDTFEDEPQEAQPEELSGAEWEMQWDEFAAQAAPFICIMPPQPPDDEIFIEQPMPDDQLIEDEVPCDVTAIDYCGNFIYEDGTLRRILIPGGYVTFANNNINQPEYNCYLTDYQGNVRMVVDQSVNTKQIYHYYPYGGLMGGKEFPYSGIVNSIYGDLQPYKYNGKELDRHSGLDWYDYGARWYDGVRFNTMDRFAEKYPDLSPYSYCAGNPINYIDVNGDSLWITHKGNDYRYHNGDLYNKDGSAYDGKIKGFLKSAINSLNSLNKTKEGASLVVELQNSANNFTIKSNEQNLFKASNIRRAGANLAEVQSVTGNTTGSKGSGGIIFWNANSTNGGLNLEGKTFRPPYIGLGHEMAHASDANQGLLHFGSDYTNSTGETYQSSYNGLLKSEWRAVYRENLIRNQAGVPLRTHYGIDMSTGLPVGIEPRLLTPSNIPINY